MSTSEGKTLLAYPLMPFLHNAGAFPPQVLQSASGMYTNFELFNIGTNKERGLSYDLLLFRSYDPKWDVLACSLFIPTQKGTFPTFYLSRKKESEDKHEKCKFYNIEVRQQPQVLGNK